MHPPSAGEGEEGGAAGHSWFHRQVSPQRTTYRCYTEQAEAAPGTSREEAKRAGGGSLGSVTFHLTSEPEAGFGQREGDAIGQCQRRAHSPHMMGGSACEGGKHRRGAGRRRAEVELVRGQTEVEALRSWGGSFWARRLAGDTEGSLAKLSTPKHRSEEEDPQWRRLWKRSMI